MTNLFGLDLEPLLKKTTEFTEQQKQIIALLTEIKTILNTKL